MKRASRRASHERGQFLILFVIVLSILLVIVGVGIDGARLYFHWTGLTRALDAACAAALRRAPQLSNAEVQEVAQQVAEYNLQQQGADISRLVFNAVVTRDTNFTGLIRINLSGTLQDIPSVLMHLLPGNEFSNVSAEAQCPACYNNPNSFNIPVAGHYQGGMECQRTCNDGELKIPGTNSCCSWTSSYRDGQPQTQCVCGPNSALGIQTDYCDPDANTPQAIDPDNPGIDGPVWLDRAEIDNLGTVCTQECRSRGSDQGVTSCNQGCREETGTICCKCHCLGDPVC